MVQISTLAFCAQAEDAVQLYLQMLRRLLENGEIGEVRLYKNDVQDMELIDSDAFLLSADRILKDITESNKKLTVRHGYKTIVNTYYGFGNTYCGRHYGMGFEFLERGRTFISTTITDLVEARQNAIEP